MSDRTSVPTRHAASACAPTGPQSGITTAAPDRYTVYTLEELASGRHYAGLTRRTLDARIASHLTQSRRGGRKRAGGLMAALRLIHALGRSFHFCFAVRVLGTADGQEAARALERDWSPG